MTQATDTSTATTGESCVQEYVTNPRIMHTVPIQTSGNGANRQVAKHKCESLRLDLLLGLGR